MIRSLLLKSIRMLNYFKLGRACVETITCGQSYLWSVCLLLVGIPVCLQRALRCLAGWGQEALVLTGDVSYMFCV